MKFRNLLKAAFSLSFILLLSLINGRADAQTISTPFPGSSLPNPPAASPYNSMLTSANCHFICGMMENFGGQDLLITSIGIYHIAANSGKTYSLYYTTTQMSGQPDLTGSNWMYLATSPAGPATAQMWDAFTGLGIILPNADSFRFAVAINTPPTTNVIGFANIALSNAVWPTTTSAVKLYASLAGVTGAGSFPNGSSAYFSQRSFVGRVTYVPAPACSGVPTGGTISPAGPLTVCAGQSVTLSAPGLPFTNIAYQWEVDQGAGWVSAGGASTNTVYTFNAGSSATYRLKYTCSNIPGGTSYSTNTVQVNVTPVTTATIPYFNDFETWINYCSNSDVPENVGAPATSSWANQPATGANSWRRHDQGVSTGGWLNNTGFPPPLPLPPPAAFKTGAYSARFHTFQAALNTPGNLDLYLNCGTASTPAGNKLLTFYHLNAYNTLTDSITILYSTNGGLNFTKLAQWDTASNWTRRVVEIPSNANPTIVRFQGKKSGNDQSDIAIDSVYIGPNCSFLSGVLSAGNITQPSPTNGCPGSFYPLTVVGSSLVGGLQYQWYRDDGAGPVPVPGATNLLFTTPTLYDTVKFSLHVKCGANDSAVSNEVLFYIPEPSFAPIPYSQSFEQWVNRCAIEDVPANGPGQPVNWINFPIQGNTSWRRDSVIALTSPPPPNIGNPGNWVNPASGSYLPKAASGKRSARFHSNQSGYSSTGNLDMLVNCSAFTGPKELSFYYYNVNGIDSLRVSYSDNGGNTFTPLASLATTPSWVPFTYSIPSNSPKTIVRFLGFADGGPSDLGLDSVKIIPACSGVPNPGVISNATPCPNVNFTITLMNWTQAGGLTYYWEESTTGTPGSWGPVTGTPNVTNSWLTTNILTATWFRCRVICTATNDTAYTPAKKINMASFYYCYCNSSATTSAGIDVGNVTIKTQPANQPLLNNGNASPLNSNPAALGFYTNYTALPPTVLYLDSLYKFFVTQINTGAYATATASVWIDLDQSGTFDIDEFIFSKVTSSSSNPANQVSDTFRIPHTDTVGFTGMRVKIEAGSIATPSPCGSYVNGETEDYLVDIRYEPCKGKVNPGIVEISDTASCVGYTIVLTDTTHEKKMSGMQWQWQSGPDSFIMANMPGTVNKDQLVEIVQNETYYRVVTTCFHTTDRDTSNIVHVAINPYYSCYCYSLAVGGPLGDTSDVGAFTIGTYSVNLGGPHLLNQNAYRARTDYTSISNWEIWKDSSYQIKVFHTMPTGIHADAKITLFMDFNNDREYDIPNERVYTGYTTGSYFTLVDSIHIPFAVITNSKSGMRLIINNNVGPNVPSDSACGVYQSGETEDYVVIFRDFQTSVAGLANNMKDLSVYPNPTDGNFVVAFEAREVPRDVEVSVLSMTGQLITRKQFKPNSRNFSEQFDLGNQAKGVYFVEVKADNEKLIQRLLVK